MAGARAFAERSCRSAPAAAKAPTGRAVPTSPADTGGGCARRVHDLFQGLTLRKVETPKPIAGDASAARIAPAAGVSQLQDHSAKRMLIQLAEQIVKRQASTSEAAKQRSTASPRMVRCICPIDERRKSVSVTGPGRPFRPVAAAGGPRRHEPGPPSRMSASEPTSDARSGNWFANQPYLLLSITAMCWAGNAIVGRLAPPHRPVTPVVPALSMAS